MCSIVEDDFGDEGGVHHMTEDPKDDGIAGEICKKCNVQESVIKLDFKSSMCLACFLVFIRHKFRATLGSTKIVRRHSKVLFYFTGSLEDVTLVDIVRHAFEQESHKRLCFDMDLIFIDDNCIYKERSSLDDRFQRIQEVRKIIQAQFPKFKCYYYPITGSDNLPGEIKEVSQADLTSVIAKEDKFIAKFNSIQSLTSKQDFLEVTKRNLLRNLAPTLNCQYVFLSETSTILATRLLSNISLGRGSSTASDVAFSDERIDSLKFVRPMKDFTSQEITSYVKLTNLKYLDQPNFGESNGKFSSIQNLTSDFVKGLQVNFSSTISTVYRTCGKIGSIEDAASVEGNVPKCKLEVSGMSNMNKRCVMCKSYLDYQNSEALFAIEFSRYVSELAGSKDIEKAENLHSKAVESVNGSSTVNRKHLCQGCRNIFIGLDDDAINEMF